MTFPEFLDQDKITLLDIVETFSELYPNEPTISHQTVSNWGKLGVPKARVPQVVAITKKLSKTRLAPGYVTAKEARRE